MRAVKRGADLLFKDPVAAWKKYCDVKPAMKTRLNALQFDRSFNYMSVDLANVQRDWNKVGSIAIKILVPFADASVDRSLLTRRGSGSYPRHSSRT
jgi:pyrimidine precursor biosynthesis enzyme